MIRILILTVFLSITLPSQLLRVAATTQCNGMAGLCQLHLDEVTFPGTHNSYSGFNGFLYHWSGSHASSKYYRNQQLSITAQLDYGIRYFDIDTCWVSHDEANDYWSTGAWACHGAAYAGRVKEILRQMDEWLRDPTHSNEVIIIDFNRDVEKDDDRRKLMYNDILKDLKALWEPTRARIDAKELTANTNILNPTFGSAVASNQRVFIFMSEKFLDLVTDVPYWIEESE